MKTSKYFAPREFERCTPPCSIEDVNQELLNRLDTLREACGIPLLLSCAYRTKEWDRSRGRTGNSAHTEIDKENNPDCKAVDIRCYSDATRMLIVSRAIELGFTRVGIENSFIHLDISTILSQNVMWTY